MDVTPLITKDRQVIQSYAGGRFKVSGQIYESALIVRPGVCELWDVLALPGFEDFRPLVDMAAEIDVVLFGSGAAMKMLPADIRLKLKEAGIAVECMDTGAACRTYNVLLAEERRVAAALLPA